MSSFVNRLNLSGRSPVKGCRFTTWCAPLPDGRGESIEVKLPPTVRSVEVIFCGSKDEPIGGFVSDGALDTDGTGVDPHAYYVPPGAASSFPLYGGDVFTEPKIYLSGPVGARAHLKLCW